MVSHEDEHVRSRCRTVPLRHHVPITVGDITIWIDPSIVGGRVRLSVTAPDSVLIGDPVASNPIAVEKT